MSATVYDFSELASRHRETEAGSIPADVWNEIGRSSMLADELAARGQHVRFENEHTGGRVIAVLCDEIGAELRVVDLPEIFGRPVSTPHLPAA